MRYGNLILAGVLAAGLALPATASAEIDPSEDVFNQQTLNVVDGAGREVPFTTAQNISRQYNTTGYTFDPGFEALERARSGCDSSPTVRGSRTAYLRFVPGVRGAFSITANTAYDVVLFAYRTVQPRGSRAFSEADLTTLTCNDAGQGIGNELNMVIPSSAVEPGQAIVLQTASSCGVGDPTKCTGNEPGGPTTLSVRFTPDDRDGDGIADTVDGCPDARGEAPNGCPPADSDFDTIPDRDDRCQFQRGVPPTGCPADTDGDGVANENDACLFQLGTNPNGCPDPDGDGVANRADLCPFVVGIATDGCPDSDKDKVSDKADKCRTVAGNGSDGCPNPIGARFPDRWLGFPTSTRVLMLQVKAAKGAHVEFRCKGKGCRFKLKRFTQKRAVHSLLPYLPKNHSLRKGIVLEVRVTAPLTLGTFVRYKIRGLRLPERTDRCIAVGGKLQKCPS